MEENREETDMRLGIKQKELLALLAKGHILHGLHRVLFCGFIEKLNVPFARYQSFIDKELVVEMERYELQPPNDHRYVISDLGMAVFMELDREEK